MMMGTTTSSPPQPQQPTRQQPGFDTLPPELLSKIFSYLDADFLACASGVCRLWNEMANSDVIWKHLCATRFPLLRHQPLDLHPRADYARLTPTLTVKEMKGILARRHVRIPRGAVEKTELVQLVKDTKPAGGPRGAWTGKWKSTYIVAELDVGRTRLTVQEFATTHTWHPAQQASLPHPTIAKFQPDG
ncbi:hypothetical protein PhCBS80983_g06363 [Powellomyces hirtus]|uniref:F-box domain-containing protein n=1 Tax=Powellomyces hirtus TaxID=109895 RepID=A0A507DNV0_9FUNG|nr:hypothetical protein PhCBS80983_g06363 [Powellomyces hirtus]